MKIRLYESGDNWAIDLSQLPKDVECDVPDETVQRWKSVLHAYYQVEEEMHAVHECEIQRRAAMSV